jgi:hypothetical protein
VVTVSATGLGFTVMGKVIDRRTLNVIFVSIVSFFSTAIPLLVALVPDPPSLDTNGAATPCAGLEPASREAIAAVARAVTNSSCSYDNVSLGSILA